MEYLNIYDYGAVGDGVADDTGALLAAMGAAEKTCGTVFFPAGEYRIRPVKVPSHITLLANPSWGYNYGVRPEPYVKDFEHRGNAFFTPQNRDAEALFDLSGCVGTRMIGISIDGAVREETRLGILPGMIDSYRAYDWSETPDFVGIAAHGGEQLMFEDVRVVTTPGDCIRLENVKGFAIRRSLLTRSRGCCVSAVNCENGVVIDSQISFNIGDGIYGKNSSGLRILSCRIEGGHPAAVRLEDCDTCTVNGNSVDCPRGMGTLLRDCANIAVGGNMYRCCGREQKGELNTHAALYNCAGCSFTGNTMWSYAPFHGGQLCEVSMILENLRDCVIMSNTLHDACTERPIEERGTMTGTIIRDNVGVPIDLENSKVGWIQGSFTDAD